MKSELQQPINSKEEIADYYDNVYHGKATADNIVPGHFHRLANKINVKQGQHVLDVACGTGKWMLALEKKGVKVAGIDISKRAIEICRAAIPEGRFYVDLAEALPFGDDQFDLISCLGALEHFLDPLKALKEMSRVAKKDARFLLLVPNKGFLTRRLGFFKGTAQSEAIENVLSLQEWQEMFESAGLRTIIRWKDLHVLSSGWIKDRGWVHIPVRTLQAISLIFWPLSLQYQVYHLCEKR